MSFSYKDRQTTLASLKENPPELLIIGGGVVGASAAAHAARLGLNVLLAEKEDIAYGASGNSTGLAHAGLRYLAQGRLGYVFHEGRERHRLQELAPQWVQPFNFLLPVYKTDPYKFWMVRLGTFIYDLMGWVDSLLTKRPLARRHRTLSAEEVKAKIPGIRAEDLVGGIEYYVDAKLQDARFTLGYAQQAAQHGARVLTHCEVTSVTLGGGRPPKIICRDVLSGQLFEFSATLVLNASGAWIDEVRQKAGMGGNHVLRSKGIHLIVDHLCDIPLIMSCAAKGRVFFAIPIDAQRTLVGTTDAAVQIPTDQVQPEARDISELLQQLLHFFPNLRKGPNLTQAMENYKSVHIRDLYWGVRPLLFQTGPTFMVSREHRLIKDVPDFWSFPGVKLTAGRAAGEEAAYEAWRAIRRGAPIPAVTWDSLPGGDLGDFQTYTVYAQKRFKLGPKSEIIIPYLISMYGTRYLELLQWTQREERLSELLLPDEPWILAQAAYAVHEEMVLTLNDFLWRRTKWAHLRDLPDDVVQKIAQTLGHYLLWTPQELTKQILDYKTELGKHRLS